MHPLRRDARATQERRRAARRVRARAGQADGGTTARAGGAGDERRPRTGARVHVDRIGADAAPRLPRSRSPSLRLGRTGLPMRIAIDARELHGKPTGVGRFLGELLSAWKTLPEAQEHEFVLLAP